MILADTSIWVDHPRKGDDNLASALIENKVACHPLIVGEVALGSLNGRAVVLNLLDGLPSLPVAAPSEVRLLVETRKLYSCGIGYVDASLIGRPWTRDQELLAITLEVRIVVDWDQSAPRNPSQNESVRGKGNGTPSPSLKCSRVVSQVWRRWTIFMLLAALLLRTSLR